MGMCNLHQEFVEVWTWFLKYASRQTDRQTRTLHSVASLLETKKLEVQWSKCLTCIVLLLRARF